MTASLNSPSCATNAPYKTYQLTVQNTGNQPAYAHIQGNINQQGQAGTLNWIDSSRYISGGSTTSVSFQMWHGVTPDIRWIYTTTSQDIIF